MTSESIGVPDETEKLHVVEIGEENNDTIYQNDAVILIESSEEEVTNRDPAQSDERKKHRHKKKKKSEAELLKTSLYNDLGLYFNDVMKGSKFKAHEPPKDLHVDHISRQKRNIIWVNPVFSSEPEYSAMNEEDRNPFIRKVFAIVCFNLIVIIGFELLVINVEFVNDLFKGILGLILLIIGIVLLMISDYILAYDYGRTCPCTGIAWTFAVFGSCLLVGATIHKAQVMEIIIAFIATLAVVVLCLGLACTSFDFTRFALYLMVIGMVLGVFSMAYFLMTLLFKIRIHAIKMILSCCWALFHSVSLVMELQMVIGGHTLEIDPSQYILGGIMITVSIVQIFLSLLRMVMAFNKD